MRFRLPVTILAAMVALTATGRGAARQGVAGAPRPQQPQTEINMTISGDAGAQPRYAVPDFIVRSSDPETAAAARLMGTVLWDDLAFEREFYMVPRDTYKSIPAARAFAEIAFDRWKELGVDGLVVGSVEKTGANAFRVEVRLFDVKSKASVIAKEYNGTAANPRLYAHTAADDIHSQQRGLRGVARTKLTFSSDRDNERVANTVQARDVKEIYVADYDGAQAEHHAGVVARRAIACMDRVPAGHAGHPRLEHLRGDAAREPDRRPRPELAAVVVARRHPHLLRVDARRELGAVRHEPRRVERDAADQ